MSLGSSWDIYYLGLARYVSRKSKDPSTKCGCVLVAPDRRPLSMGFNGFPQRLYDHPDLLAERETKYKLIIHCEMNALIFARSDLHGAICYTWPFLSCPRCAVMLIQAGIEAIVAPYIRDESEALPFTSNPAPWIANQDETLEIFRKANVATLTYSITYVEQETRE